MRFPLLLYSITLPTFLPLFPHRTITISISVSHYTRDLTIWLRTISVSMCVWLCASWVKTNSVTHTQTSTRAPTHFSLWTAQPSLEPFNSERSQSSCSFCCGLFFFFIGARPLYTHQHTEDVHVCACLLLCYVGFFSTMQAAAPSFLVRNPNVPAHAHTSSCGLPQPHKTP